ncbi:MAG: serine hydrolase domain-containing protein [Candidatus Aminicenantaceae bacterium]
MKNKTAAIQVSIILIILTFVPLQLRADTIDDYIAEQMEEKNIPGLTLGIIKDGRIVKFKAYGLASIELDVPASTETVYQLASATKSFTICSIYKLYEEGKLDLNDSISKFLPDLPEAWADVTIKHCISHSSGLPPIFENSWTIPEEETRSELLQTVFKKEMVSSPGEKIAYNQTGYVVLGMIIEKITNMRFEDFLQSEFFKPLGMTSTQFGDYRKIIKGRASMYTRIESFGKDNIKVSEDEIFTTYGNAYVYKPYLHPSAGLNSTVGDLIKWNLALDSDELLTQESKNRMWNLELTEHNSLKLSDKMSMSGGWFVYNHPRYSGIGISGGTSNGYWRFPDEGLAIILLTNCQAVDPNGIILGLAERHRREN